IAKENRVDVVEWERSSGLAVRSLEDYVTALRRFHRRGHIDEGPFAEEWESTFSIVEEGAVVGKGARIHDSVVLKGAMVESDAVVVRSVVGPSGRIARSAMVVEALVSGENGWKGNGRE